MAAIINSPLFYRADAAHFASVVAPRCGLARMLTHYSAAEYATMRCYLTADDSCGFALNAEDELVSLFNSGVPGAGREALRAAVERGARTLCCFDGFLPRLYGSLGWEETGRVAFDPAQAPAGWDVAKHGTPDVVFMTYYANAAQISA